MPIITLCACGKQLRTQDEFAGKRIKCPACGTILRVSEGTNDQPLLDAADEEQDTVELSAEQTRSLPPAKEPYWANSQGRDNLIALTDTALYVAELGEPTLNSTQSALDKGEPVLKALKEAKTVIAFDEILRVASDLRQTLVEITWRKDKSGGPIRTTVLCGDAKARDQIMDVLHDRLGTGWRMQENEQSRLRAAALPLVACGFLLLVCAYELFFVAPVPVAVLVISLVLLAGCAAESVVLLRTPRILLTIAPAPK